MESSSLSLLAQHGRSLGGGLLCFALIALLAYLIPSAIAVLRGHHNAFAILLLNVLLGWTLIGWAVALVWAFTAVNHRE